MAYISLWMLSSILNLTIRMCPDIPDAETVSTNRKFRYSEQLGIGQCKRAKSQLLSVLSGFG